MSDAGQDRLRALPKAELHVHLDGSLRPRTMVQLAAERGIVLPEFEPDALARHMLVSDAASLEEYLERFATTLSVMQDAAALDRIAGELIEDHAAENVRHVEVRFCPALSAGADLDASGVVEAVLGGLRRAGREHDVSATLIVCALRSFPPGHSMEMAELAVAWWGRGVSGFDLAGAENRYPVRMHAPAFDLANAAGVPITIHAGEGYGPASIRQALEWGHARRIGHGTRLFEDPRLLEVVRDARIPLEICLTSNVQTRVVATLSDHPARRYLRDGIPVVFGTDNRLMSGVTLTDEFEHARDHLALDWNALVGVARAGFEFAFVDEDERTRLLGTFDAAAATLSN